MNFYVYKITNSINDKIYIGQTTESLETRFKRHIGYQLKETYQSKIHKAMIKYGVSNFKIELIESVNNQEELNEREYYWINKLDTINNGYNINNSGLKCGGDTLSNHPNKKEIFKKISNSVMGEKNHKSIKIYAINIETNERIKFGSIEEAVRELDLKAHTNITKRLNGKIKKAI